MFNFLSSYRLCCVFCCIAPIFSFNSRIDAKTSHHSNFEFNIDVNAIKNCDSLEGKIDCFIDVGMQYQQATSKNFKYKKFLKQAYEHLEKENIHIDKKAKKDLEKRVQDRISERFFEHKKINKTNVISKQVNSRNQNGDYSEQASSENPNGHYSNDFREGIVEIGIGFIGVVSEIPPAQYAGGGLIIDGTIKVIRGTINYIWPEPGERNHYRERERPSRDGMAHERERDESIRSR